MNRTVQDLVGRALSGDHVAALARITELEQERDAALSERREIEETTRITCEALIEERNAAEVKLADAIRERDDWEKERDASLSWVKQLTRERDEAQRGATLLQQFSHELGTVLHLQGDGTLTLSQAVLVHCAAMTRELEKMKLEKQKLSDIVMTVCDERDAAQVRQEAKLAVLQAALQHAAAEETSARDECIALEKQKADIAQRRDALHAKYTEACGRNVIYRQRITTLEAAGEACGGGIALARIAVLERERDQYKRSYEAQTQALAASEAREEMRRQERDEALGAMASDGADAVQDNVRLRAQISVLTNEICTARDHLPIDTPEDESLSVAIIKLRDRIKELEKERDQYKVEFDATTDAVTVHIIQQRDAALARVKALEEEASLIRVAHGCGVKGPP